VGPKTAVLSYSMNPPPPALQLRDQIRLPRNGFLQLHDPIRLPPDQGGKLITGRTRIGDTQQDAQTTTTTQVDTLNTVHISHSSHSRTR